MSTIRPGPDAAEGGPGLLQRFGTAFVYYLPSILVMLGLLVL